MQKIKIAFITNNKIGGSERATLSLSKIIDISLIIEIILIGNNKNDLESFIPQNCNIKHLSITKLKYSLYTFYQYFKKNKYHSVFTSLHGISIPLIITSFIIKDLRVIIRQSFMPNRYSKKSITTLGIRFLYPYAYRIIAQTDEMKDMMIDYYKLKPERITVLSNPLDYSAIENGIKELNPFENIQGIKYVSVGNIRHIKGHDLLIKAFKQVKEKHINAHLFFVGQYSETDDYYIKLQKLTSEYNLGRYIHFVGFSSNPYKYIYNSNCFVLPSRSEGLPNVLLEAMYLKKPVVATNCIPFIDRVIINGINGYKANNENIEEIANAMIKAVNMEVKEANTYNPPTIEEITELFN